MAQLALFTDAARAPAGPPAPAAGWLDADPTQGRWADHLIGDDGESVIVLFRNVGPDGLTDADSFTAALFRGQRVEAHVLIPGTQLAEVRAAAEGAASARGLL